MDTEDEFQAAMDERPTDNHLRLIFADWLQEREDPRAEGYRVLGSLRLRADRYAPNEWTWYIAHRLTQWSGNGYSLLSSWFLHLEGGVQMWNHKPMKEDDIAYGQWLDWPTRREAEEAAAVAFLRMTDEERAEILDTLSVK
jgi:uncharacterized protein (TIGR02996 family)